MVTPTNSADREILSTRLLNAPRELVFKAFIDPDQLMHWWGPKGFTNTFEEFDPKPGGHWRFVMHGPDGKNYPNHSTFVEVTKPERIVFRHLDWPLFEMTITLAEEAGKTRIHWRMLFDSAEECAKLKSFVGGANEENFDRLEARLVKMAAPQRPFVISRVFDAPRDIVWETWTNAHHMEWWGPKGVTVNRVKLELRPGGLFHYVMNTPDGKEMWGRWIIREFVKPERLVFVNSFSDKDGGITRHPFSDSWPLELLSTVTFDNQGGKTRLTVEWLPLNANDEERKTFDAGHASMAQGWGGTLDRLQDYLVQVQKRPVR